jgi:hypothetical protein
MRKKTNQSNLTNLTTQTERSSISIIMHLTKLRDQLEQAQHVGNYLHPKGKTSCQNIIEAANRWTGSISLPVEPAIKLLHCSWFHWQMLSELVPRAD